MNIDKITAFYEETQMEFEEGLQFIRICEGYSQADIKNEQEWLAHLFRKAGIEE